MAVSSVKAIINGTEYNLTYNSSNGRYEATLTAPTQTSGSKNNGIGPGVGSAAASKGYYPVTLVATDDAGNTTTVDDTDPTLGESLRLKVKETTPPTTTIIYPTSGAYVATSSPTLRFTASDSGSGLKGFLVIVDMGTSSEVTIDGLFSSGEIASAEKEVNLGVLSNGKHTVTLGVLDYDNDATGMKTVGFTVDTVPPVLNVTSPTDGLITNVATVNIAGTTNDVTSSPVTVTATLNGVDVGAITVNDDGSFSKAITLAEGSNSIAITATDSAGKTTTVTRTVKLDSGAPVFGSVTITPNPTNTGVQYTISVEVTD